VSGLFSDFSLSSWESCIDFDGFGVMTALRASDKTLAVSGHETRRSGADAVVVSGDRDCNSRANAQVCKSTTVVG
jgi:hypothetical protein